MLPIPSLKVDQNMGSDQLATSGKSGSVGYSGQRGSSYTFNTGPGSSSGVSWTVVAIGAGVLLAAWFIFGRKR
jgi:hypothetical protein